MYWSWVKPKDDTERLAAFIQDMQGWMPPFIMGGELVHAEQQAEIVGWLKELQELRAMRAAETKASLMESLIGFYGLTQEEAQLVWADLDAGNGIQWEAGECRKCKGRGREEEASGCFGLTMRDCFTCSGTGKDDKRIKVPTTAATSTTE